MPDSTKWKASVFQTLDQLSQFAPEWAAFQQAIPSPTYRHDPDYVSRFLARGKSLSPLVISVKENGNVRSIAPFFVSDYKIPIRFSLLNLGAVRLRRLRLIGDDFSVAHNMDADRIHRVYDLVFQTIRNGPKKFDLIDLEQIPEDGRLWQHISRISAATSRIRLIQAVHAQVCHRISFASSFEEYLAQMKSRDRTNLRRRKKKLWQHFGGDVELVAVSSPDQVSSFLDAVDEISHRTWQTRTYGARTHNSVAAKEFYSFLAEKGWLRSYLLVGAGQRLAFQIGMQDSSHFYFIETGYDSRWGQLGTGTVLEYSVIEHLFNVNSPVTGDFGFGEAEYKRILGTSTHREFEHVYLAVGWGLKARLFAFTTASLEQLEKVIRGFLVRFKLDRTARKLLRRG